jgi:hypothetical protein
MAKLPPIDVPAHWIRNLLHHGKREEALAWINDLIASGKAGAETRALAEYLATAKRGRQPFGSKHLWPEIGAENDELRSAGVSYEQRLEMLSLKYRLGDKTKVKIAIARWEAALEEVASASSREV